MSNCGVPKFTKIYFTKIYIAVYFNASLVQYSPNANLKIRTFSQIFTIRRKGYA